MESIFLPIIDIKTKKFQIQRGTKPRQPIYRCRKTICNKQDHNASPEVFDASSEAETNISH